MSSTLTTGTAVTISPVTPKLHGRSTASEVVEVLQYGNQLASYATTNGVAVVTGGTSGIGLPTVEALANAGMKIVLCVRDAAAARMFLEKKRSTKWFLSNKTIRIQACDLADLNSVQTAAQEIRSTEGEIDLILNNAGVSSVPTLRLTPQNFELQFGVNHIGHFFLTRSLVPFMKGGGRVVSVSSKAHSTVRRMDLDDLNCDRKQYSPWYAYAQSKLANVLFAEELQDRLDQAGSDILSLSLHPGVVMTDHWKHHNHMLVGAVSEYIVKSKTPQQGAATNVFCSLAHASNFRGGDYVVDCRVSRRTSSSDNTRMKKKLWHSTESLIRGAGFQLPPTLL